MSTSTPSRSLLMPRTLADVLERILRDADLSATRRRDMASALRELLGGLTSEDRQKIVNALAEAAADAAQPQADKDEIGGALERALRHAGKAAGFAEVAGKIAPHVQNAVAWLGGHWQKLLPQVGLAV